MVFPKKFQKLIQILEQFPQIGGKTAERLSASIFKLSSEEKKELANAILETEDLKECSRCFNLSEEKLCQICQDKKRKQKIIAVVETPLHISGLERAGFLGSYHILGGLIASFLEEPEDLHLNELILRVKKEKPHEIILALDPSLEGETTATYVAQKIKKNAPQIRVSRLAQGLPTGADLEYADEITIREALRGRREIK